MKARYTFLNFMLNMIYWGVLGVVGIGLLAMTMLLFQYGYPLWNFFVIGMSYYMLPSIVIGAVSASTITILLMMFTIIFFPTPNPESSKFQFFTLMIVATTGFLISYVGWYMSLSNIFPLDVIGIYNKVFLHALSTSIVLTFVHYRALPHMFGTVQKRKEKAH